MPYVKSKAIRSTVQKSIAYILNPKKTENCLYATSLNCSTNASDCAKNMEMVFQKYTGRSWDDMPTKSGKGSVKAIHHIQSFSPKDNITPELAHEIAKVFALKTFGENAQVVIATHTDKAHIHSHLIVNTYTLDGKKINDNQTTLQQVRTASDEVCLLKPLEKEKVRQDIDGLIF